MDILCKQKKPESDLGTSEISHKRAFHGNVSEYLKGDAEYQSSTVKESRREEISI